MESLFPGQATLIAAFSNAKKAKHAKKGLVIASKYSAEKGLGQSAILLLIRRQIKLRIKASDAAEQVSLR